MGRARNILGLMLLGLLACEAHGQASLPAGARLRLGTLNLRHTDQIHLVSFPGASNTLISSGGGGVVLWDLKTGVEKQRYEHGSLLAVSPDGKTLALGWEKIFLVDRATGKNLHELHERKNRFLCASFSDDGKILATGGDNRWTCLWDTATGKQIRRFKASQPDELKAVAFAPDGKTVFSLGGSTLQMWDVATGKPLHELRSITAAVFSRDSSTVIAASSNEIVLWAPLAGKERKRFQGSSYALTALTLSPDGTTLAVVGYGDSIRIFDVANGKQIQYVPWARGVVNSLAFSSDGKTVAAGGWGNTVRLWDWRTRKELFAEGHYAGIGGLAFTPDNSSLISLGWDHTLRVWDLAAGKEARRWGEHLAEGPRNDNSDAMILTPDGKSAILGNGSDHLRILDLASGKERPFKNRTFGVRPAALSADGKRLITVNTFPSKRADGLTCVLWDVGKGQEVRTFFHGVKIDPQEPPESVGETIQATAFAPDGRSIVAAWMVYRQERFFRLPIVSGVSIWDIATGKEHRIIAAANQLAFLDGGKSLVFNAENGDHGLVRIWDVAAAREVRKLQGPREWGGVFAISPDGALFATSGGSGDPAIYVWRMSNGHLVRRFQGHRCEVHCLAFSPDGRMLASGSSDTTILVWEVLGLR